MKQVLLWVLLCISSSLLFAQTSDTIKYVVTKHNGIEYIGKILSDDARELLLETDNLGKIYIPKADIKKIAKIESEKEIKFGEYYSSGPFTTRYAFTTNALPIVKGENYTLINLYGPEVHFAVSNRLNIGIISTWIASPFVLSAKYTIATNNKKLNFSLGSLVGSSGYIYNFRGYGGLHFANITLGERKQNITFSAGYLYIQTGNDNVFIKPGEYYTLNEYFYSEQTVLKPLIHGPMASIAGIIKVGSKASFVFDSMFGYFNDTKNDIKTTVISLPDFDKPGEYLHTVKNIKTHTSMLFLMPGMRFQTKETKAFQVSLAGVSVFSTENTSFPFPMCTWFQRF